MISQESAEMIALKALSWLARDEDLMGIFMNSTGVSPDEIADQAGKSEFQIAVLDFLTLDDKWVRAFCEESGLQPDRPLLARQSLPGGGDIHWT